MTWVEIGGLILAGLYLALELVAAITGARTLSPLIRDAGARLMFWPALFGLLAGHFFGPAWIKPSNGGQVIALSLLLVVVAKDILYRDRVFGVEWVVFLFFLIVGATAWAQGGKG